MQWLHLQSWSSQVSRQPSPSPALRIDNLNMKRNDMITNSLLLKENLGRPQKLEARGFHHDPPLVWQAVSPISQGHQNGPAKSLNPIHCLGFLGAVQNMLGIAQPETWSFPNKSYHIWGYTCWWIWLHIPITASWRTSSTCWLLHVRRPKVVDNDHVLSTRFD